jgi:hypothetical protein
MKPAVKEVLTNPELLRELQAQTVPNVQPAKEGSLTKTLGQVWQRGGLKTVCSWIGGGLKTAWTAICAGCKKLASGCVAFCLMLPALLMLLWGYRRPVLVALGVGVLLGVGTYWAGPFVASFFSGLAGFVGALVFNLLRRLRQVMDAVHVPGSWVS